jgi:uncharacterized membrane protein
MTNGEKFHERERFEHELINRRLTWLFTSQTVLFAAYGIALRSNEPQGNHAFLRVTAIIGALIAGLILLGVVAAILAKFTAWKDYKAIDPNAQFGVRPWITCLGFAPDVLLPVIFGLAWIYIFQKAPSY